MGTIKGLIFAFVFMGTLVGLAMNAQHWSDGVVLFWSGVCIAALYEAIEGCTKRDVKPMFALGAACVIIGLILTVGGM